VLAILRRLDGRLNTDRWAPPAKGRGRELLAAQTAALLGSASPNRDVRIMVTMPSEAATDYALVRDLVASGMNCMRISTAHDQQDAWERMIGHLERARQETGRDCRVLIDLAGPKLRTGPIEPGPPIAKWRPSRDPYGRVIRPARIR
jgi:pyruvate kinase